MYRKVLPIALVLLLAVGYWLGIAYSIGLFYHFDYPWGPHSGQSRGQAVAALGLIHAIAVMTASVPIAAVIVVRFKADYLVPALIIAAPTAADAMYSILFPSVPTPLYTTISTLKDVVVLQFTPALIAFLVNRYLFGTVKLRKCLNE
jgi:hypothetical protein